MIPNFEAMKYRAGLMRSASCPMYFVMCLKGSLECDISNHYFDKTGESHYSRVRTASSLGGLGSHFQLGPLF